jgi:peptidase M28-like protein
MTAHRPAIDALIDKINTAYQPERHRELLDQVWEREVWFDSPHQRDAAELCRDKLAAAGLADVRLAEYPCDGKTRLQDWIMHMAWDCPAARLTLIGGTCTGSPSRDGGGDMYRKSVPRQRDGSGTCPQTILADREVVPASVVFWSGPLASRDAPAVGQVVDGDALDITAESVDGKFVLTALPPQQMKKKLLDRRPLAVISDWINEGRGYTDDTTKWINTWSDGPDGWYFHANDTVMPGFCISPAKGRLLRDRLAADPQLKLSGFCESKLYEGVGQNVTAVLPGTDPSHEIWLYGHACEQGGHDNCSGVSVLVETLRTLKELVDAGTLARPRHSIRIITTEECIGMIAFASLQDDLRRKALAGFNVDGAGDAGLPESSFYIHYGGLSNPTFGWALGGVLAAKLKELAGDDWYCGTKRFVPTADDMIGDPNCGIPSMWLGKGGTSIGYHSSADTADICSEHSLRYNTLLVATWAYTMAAMDDSSAAELLPSAAHWIEQNIVREGDDDGAALSRWAAATMLRDLARWDVDPAVYEPAAVTYAPANAPPLPGLSAGGPAYRRTVWGTCTYETMPLERRAGLSRWSEGAASALYWTDGVRPLPAIERLVRAELGPDAKLDLSRLVEGGLENGTLEKVTGDDA